ARRVRLDRAERRRVIAADERTQLAAVEDLVRALLDPAVELDLERVDLRAGLREPRVRIRAARRDHGLGRARRLLVPRGDARIRRRHPDPSFIRPAVPVVVEVDLAARGADRLWAARGALAEGGRGVEGYAEDVHRGAVRVVRQAEEPARWAGGRV